jgi:UDP-N-acetylglucosamine 2-epimerase (non-hydrolysing)
MKIAIILGTRPEIVKLSSIIRECKNLELDYFIIHTNQHYSPELDSIFFKDLNLPEPRYNLNIGSGTQGEQIGRMFIGLEKIFEKEKPDLSIVQGDTNSVFAGAFVSSRFGIKIAHVEAGLRSYDNKMPEEINRILTDHISNYFFCPTERQKITLLKEGISRKNILVVGNTVVDAVFWARNHGSDILKKLNLVDNKYCLLTLHRSENVDSKDRLKYLLGQIGSLTEENIIFPIHPRTKKMIELFDLIVPGNVQCIKPIGFLDMVTLEKYSKLILTDSGGVQEEACVLGVPSITLRTTTERPEVVDVGANILMSKSLLADFNKMVNIKRGWENPFGDGNSGKNIVKNLRNLNNG